MIIGVTKYIFVGVSEDLDQFFERAQTKGIIEFIPTKAKKRIEPTPNIQMLVQAHKILRKQPVLKQSEKREPLDVAIERGKRVLQLKTDIERLYEEKRIANAELVRVSPLGDFSIEEIRELETVINRKVQFFSMKSSKREQFHDEETLIYLGTEYDLDYFMSISKEPVHYPGMIEMHVEAAAPAVRYRLQEIEREIHYFEQELKSYADQIDILHAALIHELNEFHLAEAKMEVEYPIDSELFAIEAWIPENKVPLLFSILQGLAVHCEMVTIEETDRIPTYMENKGFARVGEDLVHLYDTPAPNDKDPSSWVLWSFALFFAMIIEDAGYGLLYLGLALFLHWKFPALKGTGKRFIKLLYILATAIIVWGIASCSYFGLEILPTSPLSRISIVNYLAEKKAEYHLKTHDDVYDKWAKEYPAIATAKTGDQFIHDAHYTQGKHTFYPILNEFRGNIFMEIALLTGVIHIATSLFRYLTRNWAAIGWATFMVGGYLYFPKMLHATSIFHFTGVIGKESGYAIGLQLIYIGIGFAVVLSLIQKRMKGLHDIMNVVQIFGDVLSYLRLYALGLAATIMAETFNQIGVDVGLAIGFVIILAGHAINILLGAMAGVIHGLRLNVIEWYHYSFYGGGRLFRPLQRLKSK